MTFFVFWAGTCFTTGWILRCISAIDPTNINIYIAQNILIFAGPPIYAAAEYNILGRLMYYLPYHAPLHPGRIVVAFIYIGISIESLTAAGASLFAGASARDLDTYRTGGYLLSTALALQGALECVYVVFVALMHRRAVRSGVLPPNVRTLCIMLYCTSILVIFRCICRAIESFAVYSVTATSCNSLCRFVLLHEWYLYTFEAAPMVLYTYILNAWHPGRFLPSEPHRYLDVDGGTERMGPGWVDQRSKWETFADPFDLNGSRRGHPARVEFWLKAGDWPVVGDGSFAEGSASNARRGFGWS